MIDAIAQAIGYVVLGLFATIITVGIIGALAERTATSPEVSDEAREMAKKADPNNSIEREAYAVLTQNLLSEVRELQPDETIKAEPAPLVHFDWSVDEATQEDVEHILSTLQAAGYYTHPLPDIKEWEDKATWSKERAGVWRSEPEWRIVEYGDELGEKTIKEIVDLPLPNEWQPECDYD